LTVDVNNEVVTLPWNRCSIISYVPFLVLLAGTISSTVKMTMSWIWNLSIFAHHPILLHAVILVQQQP